MTDPETRGANWLLNELVFQLRTGGQFLEAEVVRRLGRDILDRPALVDDETVQIGVQADDPDATATLVCGVEVQRA